MIRINLLPNQNLKRPATPVGWIVAAAAFLALALAAGFGAHRYATKVVPRLESRLAALNLEKEALVAADGELRVVERRIAALTNGVDSAMNLYSRRVIWSKLLQDLKEIVNADGIRLTRVAGYGRLLTIDCRTEAVADDLVRTAEKTLENIRAYSPPEADGLAGVPLRELLTEGSPVLKRIGPAQDGAGGEFSIEMLLR